MNQLILRWIETINNQYLNPLDRRRARGLMIMNLVVVVVCILGFIALDVLPLLSGEELGFNDFFPFALALALVGVIQRLILDGNILLASRVFVGMITLGSVTPVLEGLNNIIIVLLVLPIVAAGVLLRRRDLLIALGAIVFLIFVAAVNQSQVLDPMTLIPAESVSRDLPLVLLVIATGAAFLLTLGNISEQMAENILTLRERMNLLKAAAMGSAPDDNGVLVRLDDLLIDKLLYVSARVYVRDEEDQLNVYVRGGMGQRFSTARAALDRSNAVYEALERQEPVHVSPEDVVERRSHLLPSATSALAMPLMNEGRVMGVIDIQTNLRENPFRGSELMFLELVAGELAGALVKTIAQSQLRQVLDSSESANQRLQQQINELRLQLEQSFGSDWTSYLRGRNQLAFGFNLPGRNVDLTPATDLPESLKAAMLRGEVVVNTSEREQVINVPIKRYDDVLGAMSFSVPADVILSERQLSLANAVANRLAVALENARLVEQSQSQAARERKAGEISSQLLGHQEVRTLLDAAAQSFNDALGAIYTRIYLEPEALLTESEEAV